MEEKIVVHSASPHDITPEETEEIAQLLRGLNSGFEVQAEVHERTGKGITWFEVLRIGLYGGAFAAGKALMDETAKKIAGVVIEWARDRFRNRKALSKRPVYVKIYGPDGTVQSVVVKNATDEPEDRTESDRRLEESAKARKTTASTTD